MTLPATVRRAELAGDDSQTSFPFAFKVFSESDIKVTVSTSATTEDTLTLNGDYSVTLNSNQETSPGGTVTYPLSGSPLATGRNLVIVGNLPYDQPLDLPSGGNFSPVALENELDRIEMQIQQLAEIVARSVVGLITSGSDFSLPAPDANSVIGWNSLASALQNYALSDLATAIAYGDMYLKTFAGTGSQTAFTLDYAPMTLANTDVSVDGVTLVPGTDFTIAGTTLTFTSAPGNGAEILVRYGRAVISAVYPEDIIVVCSDESSALSAVTAQMTFRMPYAMGVTAVKGSLTVAQTSGSIFTVDVNKNGTTMLSTKLTIDNGEETSASAATAAVISVPTLAADDEITIDIDQIGDGTAKGLKVTLSGYRIL